MTRVPRPLVRRGSTGAGSFTHHFLWAFATPFTRPFAGPPAEPGRLTHALRRSLVPFGFSLTLRRRFARLPAPRSVSSPLGHLSTRPINPRSSRSAPSPAPLTPPVVGPPLHTPPGSVPHPGPLPRRLRSSVPLSPRHVRRREAAPLVTRPPRSSAPARPTIRPASPPLGVAPPPHSLHGPRPPRPLPHGPGSPLAVPSHGRPAPSPDPRLTPFTAPPVTSFPPLTRTAAGRRAAGRTEEEKVGCRRSRSHRPFAALRRNRAVGTGVSLGRSLVPTSGHYRSHLPRLIPRLVGLSLRSRFSRPKASVSDTKRSLRSLPSATRNEWLVRRP